MIPLYTPADIRNYAIGKTTPNDIKNMKNLLLLAGADSIHDFNDKGIRVPINTWNNVFGSLLQNLNSLSNTRVNNLTEWTQSMSSNQVSAGSVEEKTESYFESEYPGELFGKTVILTYRDIITEIGRRGQKGNMNSQILEANQRLCRDADILEIDMAAGENWNVSYSPQDKIDIGLFLLNFYFPPPDAAYNTSNPSYITFDAGSNIPSKIFGLLDQVINLVTPLNIADSATEGTHLAVDKTQKRAGVKNKYVFPVNLTNGNIEGYMYNSNIFTMKQGVNLYIEKQPGEYNETNKYAFEVKVKQGTGPVCNLIPFTNDGKTYRSGPGVEYLSEVMHYNNQNKQGQLPQPSTGVIAPINTNCPNLNIPNNALYLDVKRSGDWEQCLAALTVNKLMPEKAQSGRVILCTIDRLCALFSRSIGQNTLYHYGTKLTLFRYNAGQMSPEQIQQQIADRAASEERDASIAAEAIRQITNAFSSVNINKLLISTVSISGFKPKQQGLNNFILNIAKLLLLSSITHYMVIYNNYNKPGGDYKQFFSSIRELSGVYITPKNIEPFIDTINTYVKSINSGDNIILLPKGTFCYYDSQTVIDLYDILQRILIFTDRTKSIALVNYKLALEENNFFTVLTKISTNMSIITQFSEVLNNVSQQQALQLQLNSVSNFNVFSTNICNTPYREGCNNNNYTVCNIEYYNNLKGFIVTIIGTQTSTLGGARKMIQTGGGLNETQTQTLIENLYISLTTEFISLSVLLNDITANLVNNNSMDFDTLYNVMIINPSTVINQIASSYTKDILQILQNFFENSWYFIQQAEESFNVDMMSGGDFKRPVKTGINVEKARIGRIDNNKENIKDARKNKFNSSRNFNVNIGPTELVNIKRLYYTLYLFFACLYEDIPNDPYQMSMINTITEGIWNDPKAIDEYIYNYLLKNNVFFNNYISNEPEIGIFYSDDIRGANLKIIIKYCLKIRYEKTTQINNYVLFIFTFFVNYLKFYVGMAAVNAINTNTINAISLSNYGYYPGIINDFKNTDAILSLFNKINTATASSDTISLITTQSLSETENHVEIFKQIDIIIKILLMYTFNPVRTITHLNTTNYLSRGGKRTRKNRKKPKKQMKSMRKK